MKQLEFGDIEPRQLGRRLREARKARSLTQQEVAEALAVARNTVTAMEKGERRVQPDDICRIAYYDFVSVEAMTLRLEELRFLPSGTWYHLKDRGFRVREAQAQLGLEPRPDDDNRLPTRYRLLAVQAHENELITEGELVRLRHTDALRQGERCWTSRTCCTWRKRERSRHSE